MKQTILSEMESSSDGRAASGRPRKGLPIGATGEARPTSMRKKEAMRKPKGLIELDEYTSNGEEG